MVSDPVGVGPKHEELLQNPTPTSKYKETVLLSDKLNSLPRTGAFKVLLLPTTNDGPAVNL